MVLIGGDGGSLHADRMRTLLLAEYHAVTVPLISACEDGALLGRK